MQRLGDVRLGCDACKRDHPTYWFHHSGPEPKSVWICEQCLDRLLDWPVDLITAIRRK